MEDRLRFVLAFLLLLLTFEYIQGQLFCPDGTYGPRCEYACHCKGDVSCTRTTGECPGACEKGWSETPYCQAENVAKNKKTYQHGTYLGWNSSRAVDGDSDQDGTYGSCSWAHNTKDVFKTWWNVDLGDMYNVQSINIFFRTDDGRSQSRRKGVRVYVSGKIEEAKNEGLCYMDQLQDFSFPQSHLSLQKQNMTCTQRTGRFVILYVDRPVRVPENNCPASDTYFSCWANLELCEVEVYACTRGTYGDKCQNRCNCLDDVKCNASGVCPFGCKEGWTGVNCNNECQVGRYGQNCNMTCGYCRDTLESCDRVNGTCKACLAGWQGDMCTDACVPGTYGVDCAQTCGNCVGMCAPDTGLCSKGCLPGWIGPQCMQECSQGKFGQNCVQSCSNCATGADCDHVTGNCPAGCQLGYTGTKCHQPCQTGRYGQNCSGTCGNCGNGHPCDTATGVCPKGCKIGWEGNQCGQECMIGSYGDRCQGKCGFCMNDAPCNPVTGMCPGDCAVGWSGDKCKQRCLPGLHGTNCSNRCGSCVNSDPCDHVTGVCPIGCNPGWQGVNCEKVCTNGKYGKRCELTCGYCRNSEHCDYVDGTCPNGCETRYYGPLCLLPAFDKDEKEGSTDANLGEETPHLSFIVGGVVAGVVIAFIGIILFACLRRQRQKPQIKNHQQQEQQLNPQQHNRQQQQQQQQQQMQPMQPPQQQYEQQQQQQQQQPASLSKRRNTHTHVEILNANGFDTHDGIVNPGYHHSPTPSRASSQNTNITSVSQVASHVSIDHDDQEVLYVNVKKKTPVALPLSVPSPSLSTFQRIKAHGLSESTENVYYNTRLDVPDEESGVPPHHFNRYIKDKEATFNCFKEEFSEYPHGLKYPYEAGKRPRNKFKNRFAQMFPYDHSRVVLEDDMNEPDSDYINANYIDSVDYPNCYIATQGPNKITLKDFWRQIWQCNTGKIVMLTNLVEETKNKCEKYWPDRGTMTFGNLEIRTTQQQEHPFYTLRQIELTHKEMPLESRTIKQFHFTAWPDHGVPDTFEIVSFFKCVIRTPINLPGPMVVHCSAGVGRSGTFLALDALYHYGKRGNNIDVPKFVNKMRQQRMNMIQTLAQYKLLHYALLEALENGDTTLSKNAFQSESKKVIKQYQANQHNRILDEYEKLEELKPTYGNEHFKAALQKDNVDRNRDLNVLAADKYRPYLSTYIPDTTDYINATVIPSRTSRLGFIMTQLPMRHTIADFWRLLFDHNSGLVVSLNALDEDQEDACAWWPSQGESVCFGPLQVDTLTVETIHDEVTERTFRISRQGINDSRLIYMLTYNEWYPGKDLPTSAESFLFLLSKANMYRKSSGSHRPTTVLCLDGAMCSAIYVAISNLVEQMTIDNEVDVFNAVRQIQIRRPQSVRTKDQYFFIYSEISQYIEMSSAYKNI